MKQLSDEKKGDRSRKIAEKKIAVTSDYCTAAVGTNNGQQPPSSSMYVCVCVHMTDLYKFLFKVYMSDQR